MNTFFFWMKPINMLINVKFEVIGTVQNPYFYFVRRMIIGFG